MKGSPMYRNFGIGSPNKQTISSVSDSLQNLPNPAEDKAYQDYLEKNKEIMDSTNTANQKELQRRANQIQKKVTGDEYDKQIKEFNEKNSPSKQFEEGDYYDTRSKSPNKQKAVTAEEVAYKKEQKSRKNTPGITYPKATQYEYTETYKKDANKKKSTKSKSPNKQTISSVNDSLQNLPNPSAEKLRKEYEKALKKLQKEAQEKLNANSDSTNQSNSDVLNKRANQIKQNVSGREYEKQVDEYNEKNSPNKQKHLGGTKSGKGNVFTKRGRTQRKLNKSQDEQNKLRSEHIAENKRSTELATKAHKEKMIKKQLKNRPKTVVMKGDKDVTDQYR